VACNCPFGRMGVDEFEDFGATRRTLRGFIASYHDLVATIRDFMLLDPRIQWRFKRMAARRRGTGEPARRPFLRSLLGEHGTISLERSEDRRDVLMRVVRMRRHPQIAIARRNDDTFRGERAYESWRIV
jgi:hypothetical protein